MDTKISYAEFTRRILAEVLDSLIFSHHFICSVFIYILLDYKDFFQEAEQLATKILFVVCIATTTLVLIVFKILMIAKLGGNPGKPLYGMYIKDASTLKNVTLIQVAN
ncbi:RDD family protein [Wolbachia endosymbiont of Mansonella ozzardi]|uniref:RDD family protein n=1 Tax=Wolbachia endosymbiont of Mansonella ozzardi TaxID=137464 RepID=UPI001CE1ABC5|nr:RDD family protein [Wolbachia endosymbiont of Mansonella ozzardi]